MTNYQITNYQSGLLKKQEEITQQVTKDWTSFPRLTLEQLRANYSRPDFDPELLKYCFLDDELIGYIISKIKFDFLNSKLIGQIQFPLVLPEHKQAVPLLYEEAIQTLKKKKVNIIETRASEAWGKTIEYTKKFGYTFKKLLSAELRANLQEMAIEEPGLPFEEFSISKDGSQFIKKLIDFWGIQEEEAKAYLDYLDHIEDRIISLPAYFEEGVIVTHGAVYRTKNNPRGAFVFVSLPGSDKQFKALIAKIARVAKNNGADYLITQLDDLDIKLLERFQAEGFSLEARINLYEKKLV